MMKWLKKTVPTSAISYELREIAREALGGKQEEIILLMSAVWYALFPFAITPNGKKNIWSEIVLT